MNWTIFDIDGCISDDRHRRHLLPANEFAVEADYDAYHEQLHLDRPINEAVVQHARTLGRDVLYITARPEKLRGRTVHWLRQNNLWQHEGHFELLMRPEGNSLSSPELKLQLLREWTRDNPQAVVCEAYDDRPDVVDAYRSTGLAAIILDCILTADQCSCVHLQQGGGVPETLRNMAKTFEERNAMYGDNYKRVAPIMRVLFPDGVDKELLLADHWHLFELMVVKLTRFAVSGLTHKDSIHDTAVYAAMIEKELEYGA